MGQYTSYQPVPPSEADMPHSVTRKALQREITVAARSKEEVLPSACASLDIQTVWGKSRTLDRVWQVNKPFSNPTQVLLLKNSAQIVVTDPDGGCVYLFKRHDGTLVHRYTGFMESLIVNGATENPEGDLVVSNAIRCEMTVYPVSKSFVRKGTWRVKFEEPGLVHYCEAYEIYVVHDRGTNMVTLYDAHLRRIRSFGHHVLKEPRCLTTDHLGRIFIVDIQLGAVLVFNISGTHLYSFSTRGDGQSLEAPRGICVDPKGNLYLTDHYNNRITVYSADGRIQHHLTHDSLRGPIGIDICHDSGLLAVSSVYMCWTQLTLFKLV